MAASVAALVALAGIAVDPAVAFCGGGSSFIASSNRPFHRISGRTETSCAAFPRQRNAQLRRDRPSSWFDIGLNSRETDHPEKNCGVTTRTSDGKRRRACWSLLATNAEDDDGSDVLGVGGEGGEEGEDMMELNEDDMKEEWIGRGLNPASFDPMALIEIWETEDAGEVDEKEIDAVMEKMSKEGFPILEGGIEDWNKDNDKDMDALMEAKSMVTALKEKRGQEAEEGGLGEFQLHAEAPTEVEGAVRGGKAEGGFSGRAVGIDLGTTNSAVALIVDGIPTMVPNSRGRFTTPSVVSFKRMKKKKRRPQNAIGSDGSTAEGKKNGQGGGDEEEDDDDDKIRGGALARILVGEAAVKRIATHPRNTYSSVKRIVGRSRKEAKAAGVGLGALNVDQSQSLLRLKCPAIGNGVTIPPEDLSAEILRSLIRDAQRYMGSDAEVKRAVIAVPAYFSPLQCAATERAGELAGLEKVKLMREPEAAALAYGIDKNEDEIILVFDLGGGTFDVSVLGIGGGLSEVIATSGDSKLGGDDFDQAITEWLSDEIVTLGGGDPRSNPVIIRQLLEASRAARERLSDCTEVDVDLPCSDGRVVSTTLTRKKMESLILEPLKRIMAPMREAAIMSDISLPGDVGAFMDYDDIDDDHRDKNSKDTDADADAAAAGADSNSNSSIRKLRSQQSKAKKNARSHSRSLRKQVSSMADVARKMEGNTKLRRFPQGRMVDQVVLVGGATRMPCVQRLVAGITGVKPKRTVDPDHAVALGAAVYAGILEGEVEDQEVMTAWQASIYRMMARDGFMS